MPRRFPASPLAVVLFACAFFFTSGVGEPVSAQQTDLRNAQQYNEAGQKLLEKGSYDKALKEAEKALGIERDFPQALLLRSKALVGVFKKKYDIFSGMNNKPEVFLLLKEAAESLNKYLRLVPNAVDAEALLETLEDLRAYGQLADPDNSSRTVFRPGETTVKARLLKRGEPIFTEEARKAEVRGRVVILVVLAADGQIKHPMVISTVGYGLTESCLAAASSTTFTPAVKNGHAVSTVIQIEYNFNV